ncbi:MAG: hypothetical protein R3C26_11645 [Calditrichia bacterium]
MNGRKALRYELREKERDDYRSVSVMFYDDSANPTHEISLWLRFR